MKDMLKKLGTLALTLMVMFSMVTSVFAATQGTITLHTGKHNVNGVEFKVYKMMNATVTEDGQSAAYTIADNFKDFFVTNVSQNATDKQVYEYIKTNVKDETFQNKVKVYVTTKALTPAETLTGKDGVKEYTTTQTLEAGYYVIIPSNEGFTPIFTTVAKANQHVYLKGKTPDVDKTVDGDKWNSAQVGDPIRFKVESMVPNMTGFDKYTFKLTDTMSSGLTVTKETLNEKVTIGNKQLTDTEYTVTVKGQEITIEINDFIKYKDQANEAIVFEYDAVLNKTAFTEDKETNTANVEYGNDPDHLTQGTPDTVIVRTHKLTITKTDGNTQEKLAGAEFKLYKGNNTDGAPIQFVKTGEGKYRVATATDLDKTETLVSPKGADGVKGIIIIDGLDAETYTLVETKAPDGYNKLDNPTTITIEATSNNNGTDVTVTGDTVIVENNKGSLLPETGGMGTVLFTVVGVGGILAVLYSFMKSNKKNKLNENK
ncbi:MAG: SpaH/EbpB family LPXTG-anchored major pilin [Amedibacillus dolichus]|uniref:SpaH/EbpB family LPXTG-anchored major pilin n=1 Tax=Amedibacillus dolichus TaxID=31971 RepID=A0A942W939_9FIRM|nr:SpaH/EbpB family LPXTG-anchored major pilin [Amedibacillus dolichus]MBS4884221.1 SpaH/EbpB family LPXTG-anchored major pilin [Amedibacillus dolichus]MEE0383167.1 SpaH/EbpB family LPXTG-anchored major pilin [Amedibacillus dolichus]